MPQPTDADLTNLITFVRNLIGDANSDGCDCAVEISDSQIIAALNETREMARYERSEALPAYGPGGQIRYCIHRFEGYLAGNAQLFDAAFAPIPSEDITASDPLQGLWETATSRLIVYAIGDRYDPYQAAADALRSLRARKRGMVDTAEMGVSIRLSQAVATMESVEASLRRSARIGSITFGRSDIA